MLTQFFVVAIVADQQDWLLRISTDLIDLKLFDVDENVAILVDSYQLTPAGEEQLNVKFYT